MTFAGPPPTAGIPVEARLPAGHGLIVEFFGVPGAGKTTLATSLAAHLQASGIPARLHATHHPSLVTRGPALLAKLRSLITALTSAPERSRRARALLEVLPQATRRHDLRLWQYLIYLSDLHIRARRRAELLILDQGALQSVYSLAVLSSATSDEALADAVARVPRPDLLVALATPQAVVAERLHRRRGRGRLRHRLSRDRDALAASIDLAARVRTAAGRQGWHVIAADHEQPVDQLAGDVLARLSAPPASGIECAAQARREDGDRTSPGRGGVGGFTGRHD